MSVSVDQNPVAVALHGVALLPLVVATVRETSEETDCRLGAGLETGIKTVPSPHGLQ